MVSGEGVVLGGGGKRRGGGSVVVYAVDNQCRGRRVDPLASTVSQSSGLRMNYVLVERLI